jgi:hypothetical protein
MFTGDEERRGGDKEGKDIFKPKNVSFSKNLPTTTPLSPGWDGYGSTDLRLYTSTQLKIVNYWFYSLKHKKQNLYLNKIQKLYLAKIYF